MRGILIASLVLPLAACGSARRTVERSLEAGNRADIAVVEETFVSPELLARLVDCGDVTKHDWLLAEHRRQWLAERMQWRLEAPGIPSHTAHLLSMQAEDRDEDWHAYQPGDAIYGECKAREPFFTEEYRVELEITDVFASKSQPSLPIDLWRVGQTYYLWDDPLD